jgi:hypothetical protein
MCKKLATSLSNNALTACKHSHGNKSCTLRLLSNTSTIPKKEKSFKTLEGNISKNDSYERNKANYEKLSQFYADCTKVALSGGGEKAIQRHTIKQQKMLVTERLNHFLDDDSDFLELSMFAGLQMEYGDIPRAGVITGDYIFS